MMETRVREKESSGLKDGGGAASQGKQAAFRSQKRRGSGFCHGAARRDYSPPAPSS